jgi:hypothetical protein
MMGLRPNIPILQHSILSSRLAPEIFLSSLKITLSATR